MQKKLLPHKLLILPLAILGLLLSFILLPESVKAQIQSLEIVTSYVIEGQDYGAGDIVARALPENILKLSTKDPNEAIVGVLVPEDLPIAIYRSGEEEELVAQRGVYPVNVTNINGDIFPGDFITTSIVPGKGQRAASISEAILGLAIEELTPENGTPTEFEGTTIYSGSIMVDLAGRPEAQNLGTLKDLLELARRFGVAFLSRLQTSEGASQFIRYMLAAIITLVTVYFAFRHFGVAILNGIEAIGRNPLARTHIQSAIIINAIIVILVSVSVVVLSLVIIRL